MRIGVVPELNSSRGGIYQYSLIAVRALLEWKKSSDEDELIIFTNEPHLPNMDSFSFHGNNLRIISLRPPSVKLKVIDNLMQKIEMSRYREKLRMLQISVRGNRSLPDPDRVRYNLEMRRWFLQYGVDLMFYPTPNPLSFESKLPFVMAIHDLQHRIQPEFPEVSANGEWEWREYLYRNAARYATLILADSEVGKEDILNYYGAYGITSDRVKVLPFLPAYHFVQEVPEVERQRVRKKYSLPERFLFYPAQFWPHKNHKRIIQALGLLKKERQLVIPIVFTGSNSGEIRLRTFKDVLSQARKWEVESQICYLSYVPDEDMSSLYAEADALVMPTFFGPTNIPVLEAWSFSCPVLTSDIRGIREQTADAAVLVDPGSVEAIADGIYRLWTDENLHHYLAERGQQRLGTYTPRDFQSRLNQIMEEAKFKVQRDEMPALK